MKSFTYVSRLIVYNLLVTLAVVIAFVPILEIYFRIDGKYKGLAEANLEPSNTVWTRYSDSIEKDLHPDLKIPVILTYDSLGARNDPGVSISKWRDVVALFGDSFTENRQIDHRFTIDGILNAFLGEERVANFGVNGFGLEQSIQRYLNVRQSLDADTVVYIFCSNDLRNTYEVSLFDVDALNEKGILVNTLDERRTFYETARQRLVRLLSRLHTTYFLLESRNFIRYNFLDKPFRDIAFLSGKFHDDGTQFEDEWRARFEDEFADALVTKYLSGRASAAEMAVVAKFRLLLEAWARQVRADGARFVVAAVPGGNDRALLRKLIANTEIEGTYIELPRTGEIDVLHAFDNRFENDGHWNEMGNLAAAAGLLTEVFGVDADRVSAMVSEFRDRIVTYYAGYGSHPRPAPHVAQNAAG